MAWIGQISLKQVLNEWRFQGDPLQII